MMHICSEGVARLEDFGRAHDAPYAILLGFILVDLSLFVSFCHLDLSE